MNRFVSILEPLLPTSRALSPLFSVAFGLHFRQNHNNNTQNVFFELGFPDFPSFFLLLCNNVSIYQLFFNHSFEKIQ